MQGQHSECAEKNKNQKSYCCCFQGKLSGLFVRGIVMNVFAIGDSKSHARGKETEYKIDINVAEYYFCALVLHLAVPSDFRSNYPCSLTAEQSYWILFREN